jgi:hypothetical protein
MNLLLAFTTFYGFKILNHTFVAATLAKFKLGKVYLETKRALILK